MNHGLPFGAIVVKDNEIIARGHNQVVLENDISSHGEIVALRNAGKIMKNRFLKGCEIYCSTEPVLFYFKNNFINLLVSYVCSSNILGSNR